MSKRKYRNPILMLDDGGDETIHFGGSQGTSGYDSIFKFEDDDLEALIGDWSDEELAALDTDGNQIITWDEYGNG